MRTTTLAAAMLAAGGLAACTPGMDAAFKSFRGAVAPAASLERAELNPKFRYLRVTINGRLAFLALGHVDPHPDGPVEVWFSAQREVLRLQNGRLAGLAGLTTEWRNVSLAEAPAWPAVRAAGGGLQWVRVRDVMPGYRFGIRDALVLKSIPAPRRSQIRGVDPQALAWFEEHMRGPDVLPPARYAVDMTEGGGAVVYGEQCVAPEICFTWQRWSAQAQQRAREGS